MNYRMPLSEGRRRKSGGQSIIESAFTMLPLFALILGTADFGFMIFRWTTLQNAVREGVRYAMEEYCERRTVVAWRG